MGFHDDRAEPLGAPLSSLLAPMAWSGVSFLCKGALPPHVHPMNCTWWNELLARGLLPHTHVIHWVVMVGENPYLSLVIADQHVAENMYPGPVHRSSHPRNWFHPGYPSSCALESRSTRGGTRNYPTSYNCRARLCVLGVRIAQISLTFAIHM